MACLTVSVLFRAAALSALVTLLLYTPVTGMVWTHALVSTIWLRLNAGPQVEHHDVCIVSPPRLDAGGSVLHAKRGGSMKAASLELRLRQEDVLDVGVLGAGEDTGAAGAGAGAQTAATGPTGACCSRYSDHVAAHAIRISFMVSRSHL
jgi:hypothetical protein